MNPPIFFLVGWFFAPSPVLDYALLTVLLVGSSVYNVPFVTPLLDALASVKQLEIIVLSSAVDPFLSFISAAFDSLIHLPIFDPFLVEMPEALDEAFIGAPWNFTINGFDEEYYWGLLADSWRMSEDLLPIGAHGIRRVANAVTALVSGTLFFPLLALAMVTLALAIDYVTRSFRRQVTSLKLQLHRAQARVIVLALTITLTALERDTLTADVITLQSENDAAKIHRAGEEWKDSQAKHALKKDALNAGLAVKVRAFVSTTLGDGTSALCRAFSSSSCAARIFLSMGSLQSLLAPPRSSSCVGLFDASLYDTDAVLLADADVSIGVDSSVDVEE